MPHPIHGGEQHGIADRLDQPIADAQDRLGVRNQLFSNIGCGNVSMRLGEGGETSQVPEGDCRIGRVHTRSIRYRRTGREVPHPGQT
jgi:hypothetical protein